MKINIKKIENNCEYTWIKMKIGLLYLRVKSFY